jgi:hypothetical protein
LNPRDLNLEQAKRRVKHWQRNPLDFIVDFFGDNIRDECRRLTGVELSTYSGLTTQQEEAFNEFGKIVGAKLDSHAGKKLTDEEREYAEKIGVSIMSGQGTGKDFFAALCLTWFMTCFSYPKCSATANTNKQLMNVYWSEISKVMGMAKKVDDKNPSSPTILQEMFEVQTEKVFNKQLGKEEKGKRWFCEAITVSSTASPEDQGTAMAGRHERHMLFVFDEASGINDAVFKPVEGTLTGLINLVLIIFNPTKRTGFAVESQKDSRFVALHWDAEKSEIVSRSHIEGMARKYGRDSMPFRIRVKGLPPISDTDTLIPWEWIDAAVNRDIEPSEDDQDVLGVDVGAGGDKSVMAQRRGPQIVNITRKNTKDTMELVGWVSIEMDEIEAKCAIVDPIGIGHGVFCRLKEMGYQVYSGDVRKKPTDEAHFNNKRDEMYWKLRERFEDGTISIPDDRELIDQLAVIKYFPTSDGKMRIESKKDMRKRGLESPDSADAVALTFYLGENQLRKRKTKRNKVRLKGVFLR